MTRPVLALEFPLCTATIDQSSGNVACVGHPSEEAIATLGFAKRLRQRSYRNRVRENTARDENRGFCVTSISMYLQDIADIDAAVEELKAAGRTDMTRSKLLRIGFRRLDLKALARERRSE